MAKVFLSITMIFLLIGSSRGDSQNKRMLLYFQVNNSAYNSKIFARHLQKKLYGYGVNLVAVQEFIQPQLTLKVEATSEGGVVINWDVFPLNNALRYRSPVLEGKGTRSLFFKVPASVRTDDVFLDDFSTLGAALGLYALDRCDLAQPLLEAALKRLMSGIEETAANTNLINFYLGNCALIVDDFDTAITLFETIIAAGEHAFEFSAVVNLAWLYVHIGQPETGFKQMQALIDAVLADEQYANLRAGVYAKRAQLYALTFDYDAAVDDMDTALSYAPHDPALYVLRGQMVLLTYEWDAVLADYNKALMLDPLFAEAYFYRGVLFYSQGPRERALEDFEMYLRLDFDGVHSEEAARYVESIRVELDALGTPEP